VPASSSSPVVANALWIANGTNVVEYLSTQLGANGATVPEATLSSTAFGAPQGVRFDKSGNLYVIDGGTVSAGGLTKPAIEKFTPTQLAAAAAGSTNQVPTALVTSTSFVFPQQAVFDGSGNLWVSDSGADSVFEFSAAQIANGGNQVPVTTLGATPGFSGPLGIAFDGSGDLFVANSGGTTIDEFTSAALGAQTGDVTLAPFITISDDGNGSIAGPWAIAFDASGNLWSSNANSPDTIVEFSASSILTGPVVPAVTIRSASVSGHATLNAPNGIAFDASGDLAVISSASPFGIAFYSKSQLGTSGATTPSAFITGTATTLNAPAGATFGPATI